MSEPKMVTKYKSWAEIREHMDRQKEMLRKALEQEFGVVGHPKAEKLWSLAWDFGHAAGDHEVRAYYQDMVELLK